MAFIKSETSTLISANPINKIKTNNNSYMTTWGNVSSPSVVCYNHSGGAALSSYAALLSTPKDIVGYDDIYFFAHSNGTVSKLERFDSISKDELTTDSSYIITCLAMSSNNNFVFAGTTGSKVLKFSNLGEYEAEISGFVCNSITCLSEMSGTIIAGADSGKVFIYNTSLSSMVTLDKSTSSITSILFLNSSGDFVFGNSEGKIFFYEQSLGEVVYSEDFMFGRIKQIKKYTENNIMVLTNSGIIETNVDKKKVVNIIDSAKDALCFDIYNEFKYLLCADSLNALYKYENFFVTSGLVSPAYSFPEQLNGVYTIEGKYLISDKKINYSIDKILEPLYNYTRNDLYIYKIKDFSIEDIPVIYGDSENYTNYTFVVKNHKSLSRDNQSDNTLKNKINMMHKLFQTIIKNSLSKNLNDLYCIPFKDDYFIENITFVKNGTKYSVFFRELCKRVLLMIQKNSSYDHIIYSFETIFAGVPFFTGIDETSHFFNIDLNGITTEVAMIISENFSNLLNRINNDFKKMDKLDMTFVPAPTFIHIVDDKIRLTNIYPGANKYVLYVTDENDQPIQNPTRNLSCNTLDQIVGLVPVDGRYKLTVKGFCNKFPGVLSSVVKTYP